MKTTSLAAALGAILTMGAVGHADAAFERAANASGSRAFPAPTGGASVLYSQLDNPSGNGAPDQNFEAAFDAYDSEAADDFNVTDALGWDIQTVNTVGTTGTAGGSLVNVTFYNNSPGGGDTDLPGTAVCTYTGLTPVDTAGSFAITLPTACSLPQGIHWLAIQVTQDFGVSGQHFWSNRTTQSGSEAVWRNPGNGFAAGCTAFTPVTLCGGIGGGTNPDFLFSLTGVLGVPADADLSLTKTAQASGAVEIGSAVNFVLTASNAGPADATNVVVTDNLPAGLAFASSDCGATAVGQTVTWNVGALANGASAVCNLSTTVQGAGSLDNSATITATEADGNTANNTGTASVTGVVPTPVPVVSNWLQIALLGGLFALMGLFYRRR